MGGKVSELKERNMGLREQTMQDRASLEGVFSANADVRPGITKSAHRKRTRLHDPQVTPPVAKPPLGIPPWMV